MVELVLEDNYDAADKLAEAKMKRVALVALEYWEKHDKKIDLLDLIQWGNNGLLRAVQSYTAGEYRFWDYASWWVRKEIEDKLKNS